MDEKKILEKLREICLALPKTSETTTFGHPTFQVGTKTFTVLETYKGVLSICVKVGKKMQPVFLEDPVSTARPMSASTAGSRCAPTPN
jgi:predicted DNA-binding protein (MmcQ/YjbR family)